MITLEELGKRTKAKVVGDRVYLISGVADLASASSSDLSFLANPKYVNLAMQSAAGALCVDSRCPVKAGKNYLISDNPSHTFQQVVEIFHQASTGETGFTGIHPTAVVHPSTVIGEDVTIGPYSVIDQGAIIGPSTTIYSHVYIGPHVRIGTKCLLYPHVTLREGTVLENRVILQPGVVIGSCGFGYLTDAEGKHKKLHQFGHVHIKDDVEIGANTTIDRARFKKTIISRGTKIDNLVQIGHNVIIGEDCIVVAQTGFSGSVTLGDQVFVGGQTGFVGHIKICDKVKIGAQSGVSKSIDKPGNYRGFPLAEVGEFNRWAVHLKKLTEYAEKISSLEKRLSLLENKE